MVACWVMVSLVVVMGFVVVLSSWAGGRPLGELGVWAEVVRLWSVALLVQVVVRRVVCVCLSGGWVCCFFLQLVLVFVAVAVVVVLLLVVRVMTWLTVGGFFVVSLRVCFRPGRSLLVVPFSAPVVLLRALCVEVVLGMVVGMVVVVVVDCFVLVPVRIPWSASASRSESWWDDFCQDGRGFFH